MRFSRVLAFVFGIFLPAAETVRRWGTFRENPVTVIEDWVLGAILLYAAWLAGRDFRRGQLFLAAAWGIAIGVGYGGLMGQVQKLQTGEPDPAPIPSAGVLAIKAGMMALALIALAATLRARERS